MIRREIRVYCDEEHGDGDHTFPPRSEFADGYTVATVLAGALRHGWTRKGASHYCPSCSESMAEESAERKRAAQAQEGSTRCPATMSLFPEEA